MTNRQWIQRVLAHQDGVPVPYNLMFSPISRRLVERHLDTEDVEHCLDLPVRMTGPQSVKPLYASPQAFGDTATDEFGVVWSTNDIDRGAPIGPCLTGPSLDDYTFPNPAAEYRFEHLDTWCRDNIDHYRIVWIGDLWERATFMCGMERLLLYVAAEPDFVHALLRSIAAYVVRTLEILLDRYSFEGVALSDDYGTQKALILSPTDWRRFIKPHLDEIFSTAKAAGRTTFLHSCGNVTEVVPDLVELDLDILHPIQPEAMDVVQLKRQYGERLTFCGGLGTQDLLVRGNPDDVCAEVLRLIQIMGRGGGYILEPGITIQADVPLENILAVVETMQDQA